VTDSILAQNTEPAIFN